MVTAIAADDGHAQPFGCLGGPEPGAGAEVARAGDAAADVVEQRRVVAGELVVLRAERGQPGDTNPWNQMRTSSPASAKALAAESACSIRACPPGLPSLCSDITTIAYLAMLEFLSFLSRMRARCPWYRPGAWRPADTTW